MDMIGHQLIGMQSRASFRQRLAQPVPLGVIVLLGKTAGRAIMTALDDVMRVVGDVQAGASWHTLSLAQKLNRAWPL